MQKLKKNSSGNFTTITFVLYIRYLPIFAWSHECLAEVKSSSYTNLCIIPHKELRQSSEALSDASIKIIFLSLLCYRQESPARADSKYYLQTT